MKRMYKKIYYYFNFVCKIFIAVLLVGYMVLVLFSLTSEDVLLDTKTINMIALMMILFSLPGITDQIARLFNPNLNKKKIACKCPNCRHLVVLEIEENE
jgi:uncharacterized membrane protein